MAASTTFSLFFPLPNKHQQWPDCDDHSSITNTSPSSSTTTASVDCTLSLWTPSSRCAAAEPAVEVTNNKHVPKVAAADHHHQASSYYCRQSQGQGGKAKACASPHDAFADRRCANCGTSSTPLWRNGPRGPKSLCNACGIRFKKEERRAAAMEAGCGYIAQYEYGEAAFPCGGPGDADAPFLAWRLNVVASAPAFAAVWPERTTLFQYN